MIRKQRHVGKFVNIASHALLTVMVAQVVGLEPGHAHLYSSHFEQARVDPEFRNVFAFRDEDFELVGCEADTNIKLQVAV